MTLPVLGTPFSLVAGAGETKLADGGSGSLRVDRLSQIVTATPVYYEAARNNRLFQASMQAGSAMGVALTATAVTLTLLNPSGSTVNLALVHCNFAMTAGQTTTATGESLVYAFDPAVATALTKAIVVPALLTPTINLSTGAGNGAQGVPCTAATLSATPKVVRIHPWGYNAFTTNATTGVGSGQDFIEGGLVLAPGCSITLQGLATTTGITGIVSFTWAEIPV